MAKRKNNNWILFGLLGVVALLVVGGCGETKIEAQGRTGDGGKSRNAHH
jgi:hypothetical protein